MKPISKRLFSLLLAVILVLGLPSTAMAATIVGSSETTVTEPTDMTESTDSTAKNKEETGLIITPDPIVAENPYDPDWPYPYGLPVDNDFPDDFLEVDPYGIALLADMNLIPAEMYDNSILRALEYTGYDVQKMKDNGWLYVTQYTGSSINNYAPEVLSNIGYDDASPFMDGDETVEDSSTVTGKAPDIVSFESNGLVCASFVTYYMCNYLPNIEGIDTTWIHDAVKATTMNNGSYSTSSVWSWETGLTNLANSAGSGVTKYTDADTAYANLVPGDLIVFTNSSGSLTHIAVYAGAYTMYNVSGSSRGTYHYIIHVGNSRGPEISTVEYMVSAGAKASEPSAWYHIDLPEVQSTGFIEVYKKDPDGNNLSGAYFTAVDQATNDKFIIGPTDTNGYAKSGEMPLGTYVVTETVFPDGYGPSEETSWTVTLTEDTPNMTVTINAVNELTTGGAKIVKVATNGGSLAGWHFDVTDADGNVIGTYVTDSTGVIALVLEPGTYTVTETDGEKEYWENDANPTKTVTVKAGQTAQVTFTNKWLGKAKVIKTTTNGGSVEGWTFTIKNSTGTFVGKYTTGANGLIVADLEPDTYTVQETPVDDPYWICDTEVKTITVKAGETASVSFQNRYIGKAKIIKTLEDTNAGTVEGWTFEVKDSNGTVIGTYITDADGIILCELAPGQYTVTEILEDSSCWECVTDISQTVTVKAGQTAVVTFTNRLMPDGIVVYKIDPLGAPLAGAEFLLEWSEDGMTWTPVTYKASGNVTKGTCTSTGLIDGKLESGRDGVIHFTGLHPELQYRLTETKAPEGYNLLAGPAYEGPITPDETMIIELTVVNAPVYELPMTGTTGSTVATILQITGTSVLLLALLYIVKKRR